MNGRGLLIFVLSIVWLAVFAYLVLYIFNHASCGNGS